MNFCEYTLSVILLFTCVRNLEAVLKCYACTMTPPSPYSNATPKLCSHFDYSESYVVECPYSTFCVKKQFSVNLSVSPSGTSINGTLRNCAQQRYDYQNFKNGKWQMEVKIEEPYKEGCAIVDDKGQKISRTEFCYCRGDLCNGAGPPAANPWVLPVFFGLCSYFR